jgi:hypothetical protein
MIDAITHRRVDVLPDRKAATLAAWLREHPGVQVVCRDGSAAYAEAIRQGAPKAVQVSDRWHLWHNLAAAVEKCVVAHATCWNATPRPTESALAARTRQRHAAVHDLLGHSVRLLECARRLGWSHRFRNCARDCAAMCARCAISCSWGVSTPSCAALPPQARISAPARSAHGLGAQPFEQVMAEPKDGSGLFDPAFPA